MMTPPTEIGARVRITQEVWRYPHFKVYEGMTGTVVTYNDEVIAVRMDETIPGAEGWNNEVHWYPSNGDDSFADDVEEVTP